MDKEKILAAIAQNEAVISDPSTPEDMRASLTAATDQARAQLAEYERDPHGQKRLVDDCHVLLVEIRDSISGFREMAFAGADIRVGRQIAEHGALVHSNVLPPAAEQTFEDDFMVYDYRTHYFNEMPSAVSLFNRLMQEKGASAYKPLFMAVARDCDRVLEVLHLARKGEVVEQLVRNANQDALRAAFFLNPLVINLTDYNANINDWFPFFLMDALTEIAASWNAEVVISPVLESGGNIGDLKIDVHKKNKALKVDMKAYHKVQRSIIKKLKKDGLLKEHASVVDDAFKKEIQESFEKHVHFAEEITADEKEKILEHFCRDTWNKAHGQPGLFKKGGEITFDDKVKAIAKNLVGKPVPKKYQKIEGKRFTKKTAAEAARRIVGKAQQTKRRQGKKMLLGGAVIHAPGNMGLMNLNNLDIHSVGGMAVV